MPEHGEKRSRTRFPRIACLVYLLIGCGPEDCTPTLGTSYGSDGYSGGCEYTSGPSSGGCEATPLHPGTIGALGNGAFQYVCPSDPNPDAWCMAQGVLWRTVVDEQSDGSAEAGDASDDAGPLDPTLGALTAIARKDGGLPFALSVEASIEASIPDVLMGAAFQLSYTPFAGDAGTLTPAPVLASLAESTGGGSALKDNVWAAYTVMEGPAMLDYIHVHARPMASLDVVIGGFDRPVLAVGRPAPVVAFPLAVDGSMLAGSIACTFASSDESIATVASTGATAVLNSIAAGSVTVTATCNGMSGSATVTIEPVLDAGAEDAGDDESSSADTASDAYENDGMSSTDGAGDAGEED
jgi:hypothetical protein